MALFGDKSQRTRTTGERYVYVTADPPTVSHVVRSDRDPTIGFNDRAPAAARLPFGDWWDGVVCASDVKTNGLGHRLRPGLLVCAVARSPEKRPIIYRSVARQTQRRGARSRLWRVEVYFSHTHIELIVPWSVRACVTRALASDCRLMDSEQNRPLACCSA